MAGSVEIVSSAEATSGSEMGAAGNSSGSMIPLSLLARADLVALVVVLLELGERRLKGLMLYRHRCQYTQIRHTKQEACL